MVSHFEHGSRVPGCYVQAWRQPLSDDPKNRKYITEELSEEDRATDTDNVHRKFGEFCSVFFRYANGQHTYRQRHDDCDTSQPPKGKVFPYSFPSFGPGADPVYRQSAHRWFSAIHLAVGCHYFLLGLRLPFQPKSITAHRPVPNYTPRWQRRMLWAACQRLLPESGPAEIRTFGSRSAVTPRRPTEDEITSAAAARCMSVHLGTALELHLQRRVGDFRSSRISREST